MVSFCCVLLMTLEEGRFLLCIIDNIRGGSVGFFLLLMTLEEGRFLLCIIDNIRGGSVFVVYY